MLDTHSLVFKQCLLITLGIAIVFGSIFFILRLQTANRFSDMLIIQGREISESNVAKIDKIFSDSVRIGEMIVRRLEEEKPAKTELPRFLEQLLQIARDGRPEIMALVVAYEPYEGSSGERMLLASYSGKHIDVIKGGDYRAKTWYSNVKEQLKGLWTEPFVGDFIKEPISIYTLPFYDTDEQGVKRFAGVVCVDISLAFLRTAISDIFIKDSGYAFLLSESGRVVAHPHQEWVFKESINSLADSKHSSLADFGKEIKVSKNGLFVGKTFSGEEAFIYFTQMKSNNWTFCIVFPTKEFFAQQKEFDFTFLIVGFCGFFIMLLVVFVISIRVSRPLKILAKVAEAVGKGHFDVPIPSINRNDEIGMFASAFNQMRLSLADHIDNLRKVTAAKEKIESELKVAQEIQIGILPKILPPFPKCDYFEIDAFLAPAHEVGGDLYDFFLISPTKVCLVIGDVSGKGVPASLFMAVTQTLHRGLAHGSPLDPRNLVIKMNQALCNNNSANLFVTYLFALLDLDTGIMTYCNAGHNPFLVMKEDGRVISPAKRHGIPLGLRLNRPYEQSELQLEIGDTLFLYTDGIPEAKNSNGVFFGLERLMVLLQKAAENRFSPNETVTLVRDSMSDFVGGAEQFDDITVVCLKILKYVNPQG